MNDSDSSLVFLRAPKGLERRELRQYLGQLRSEVAGGRPFNCLLTDDRELQRLNRQFLDRDYATDVLSFPSGENEFLGEIAISVARGEEQARQYGHTTTDEIKILMLHGVLHLLGMDHERDRGLMARTETRWRKQLGLPTGLIERAHA